MSVDKRYALALAVAASWVLVMAACSSPLGDARDDVVRVIGKDQIRSIDEPRFDGAGEADAYLSADEPVLGVNIGEEARAYPVTMLSRHEIVNDWIGGTPIAVTW